VSPRYLITTGRSTTITSPSMFCALRVLASYPCTLMRATPLDGKLMTASCVPATSCRVQFVPAGGTTSYGLTSAIMPGSAALLQAAFPPS
jgi:hypothetical protein